MHGNSGTEVVWGEEVVPPTPPVVVVVVIVAVFGVFCVLCVVCCSSLSSCVARGTRQAKMRARPAGLACCAARALRRYGNGT